MSNGLQNNCIHITYGKKRGQSAVDDTISSKFELIMRSLNNECDNFLFLNRISVPHRTECNRINLTDIERNFGCEIAQYIAENGLD